MKRRTLSSIMALVLVLGMALTLATPAGAATPTFTGDVPTDFTGPGILTIPDPGGDAGLPNNAPAGTISGWDMADLRLTYNATTDTLYVGINTFGIAGDADGDGFPGGTSGWLAINQGADNSNLGSTETIAVYFDLNQDGTFDVIAGVSGSTNVTGFTVADFSGNPWNPAFAFGTALPTNTGSYHANPSAADPDFEFTILDFSTLPGQDALLGGFRVWAFMGSLADDGIGEDFIRYEQKPSTITTIASSAAMVASGDTVDLTVTEANPIAAYSVNLTNPQVAVNNGTTDIAVLNNLTPGMTGDTNIDGILNVGETWSWNISSGAINATTTFVATGSGIAPGDFLVTYPGDLRERDEVTVDTIKPDTITTITASATKVLSGGSVNLTVTERNTGSDNLTNPYVEVRKDGTLLATLKAPPDSGDTAGLGVLNVGETWSWNISSGAINTTTKFVALGFGTDSLGNEVSYAQNYLRERDEVTVDTIKPDTITTITASATKVLSGGSVNLTVTERNTGSDNLTNPYVEVRKDGTLLATLKAPPDSGDTAGLGVLNVGETWSWNISSGAINTTTKFVALGFGTDSLGNEVSYPEYEGERDEVTVDTIKPDTITTITASATKVLSGGSVNLTVTERNTGDDALTNPYVEVRKDGTLLATLKAPPDSGDTAGLGVLNVGETWSWNISSGAINTTTKFVALGFGTDSLGNEVSYAQNYLRERDEVKVETIEPDTITTITASATKVLSGGSVNLTVTERNTGSDNLTNPYVEVRKDGTLLATLKAPPDSGDTAGLGVLNVGETWSWNISSGAINTTTKFVALGFGTDSLGNEVSYPEYEGERDEVTVDTIKPDTITTITASATKVLSGGSVNLTVTERNTGDDALTNPYVEVWKDGTLLATLKAPPDSGDTAGLGILNVGETWSWNISSGAINTTTKFVALGFGTDSLGNEVSYAQNYLRERDEVKVETIEPDTITTITASATKVLSGGSVNLTVTERNTGSDNLTNPYVEVRKDGTLLATLKAPPDSGDTAGLGVLNVGETWSWNISSGAINTTTKFVALGFGTDSLGNEVSYPEYEGERDEVTVDTIKPDTITTITASATKVLSGGSVNLTVTERNTGSDNLTNPYVEVWKDGTLLATLKAPPDSGDTAGLGILNVGETWSWNISSGAINTTTKFVALGFGTDSLGNEVSYAQNYLRERDEVKVETIEPDTITTITASATKVLSGGSVNLTVTERNTGSDNLTNPYVEVRKDGTLLATLKAPPDSGDTAGLGVLNVGETWSWNISSGAINTTTKFVALGFGTDSLGNEVSYPEYEGERDEVTVDTIKPDTITTITASATKVLSGGSVNLTVTERNTGSDNLTNPYVEVWKDGTLLATLKAPPDSGDTAGLGILNVGETWSWNISSGAINTTTKFVALGFGTDSLGNEVSYAQNYLRERDEVKVETIEPDTITTITASATKVLSGGSVNLTVTERNTGSDNLTNPYVEVRKDGTLLATLKAPPDSGDTAGLGVLNVGETWSWNISSGAINTTTKFVALGFGTDSLGNEVSYAQNYLRERDEVKVDTIKPDTITTITASATKVLSGGSVNLTVTERNTGSDNLTNPYVEVWKDGTLLATLKAPPDSGDTAGLGILNVGETWSWNISSGAINTTTKFVALGFGTDSLGNEVSYAQNYLRERDEVKVETIEPDTITTITASATKVLSGGSVNLTVTERNTGSDNLTNPYVEVRKDGTLLATLKAPPDSGDTAGLGVLNVGETWSWNISSGAINTTTKFVALGFGTDSLGNEVSYPEYEGERDEVTVDTIKPDTITTITASATKVLSGGSVNLTVTERNTGDDALTNPYVEVWKDGTLLATLKAPPDSGDTAGLGILNVGETWSWNISSGAINTTTKFVALGFGTDSLGNEVSYAQNYLRERDEVKVETIEPDTITTITASATKVLSGGSVNLTVTERNTGSDNLTNPYVEVRKDGTLLATLKAPPDSGDTAGLGVLNVGETWSWNISSGAINTTTKFVALGFGTDSLGNEVSYPEYEGERDEVTVDTIKPDTITTITASATKVLSGGSVNLTVTERNTGSDNLTNPYVEVWKDGTLLATLKAPPDSGDTAGLGILNVGETWSWNISSGAINTTTKFVALGFGTDSLGNEVSYAQNYLRERDEVKVETIEPDTITTITASATKVLSGGSVNLTVTERNTGSDNLTNPYVEVRKDGTLLATLKAPPDSGDTAGLGVLNVGETWSWNISSGAINTTTKFVALGFGTDSLGNEVSYPEYEGERDEVTVDTIKPDTITTITASATKVLSGGSVNLTVTERNTGSDNLTNPYVEVWKDGTLLATLKAPPDSGDTAGLGILNVGETWSWNISSGAINTTTKFVALGFGTDSLGNEVSYAQNYLRERDEVKVETIEPDTITTITASATKVLSGGSVNLTVTERNTGSDNLTNPYVEVRKDGTLLATLKAPPDSGDTAGLGVLNVGETWSWNISSGAINTTTKFVALGFGTDSLGNEVSYAQNYLRERDEVKVDTIKPDTITTITASATKVLSGGSVNLTVTERNTGSDNLTNPYVEVWKDGTLLATLKAPPDSGDTAGLGILNVGETWSWNISSGAINTTTKFVALGFGTDSLGNEVSYAQNYLRERDEVKVETIEPDTITTITASATKVLSGGSVNLTVTERNTGSDNLTNPYVEVRKDGTLLATLKAPPDSGDTAGLGVLNVGETWSWNISSGAINTTTKFVALGFGTDSLGNEVSYAQNYLRERDEVTVDTIKPDTITTITASATKVLSGGSVNLTVTERNTGSDNLTNPYVEAWKDGTLLATLKAPPDSGDTAGLGILNVGETWSWNISSGAINTTTKFVALGFGTDSLGNEVSYAQNYLRERDEVKVETIEPDTITTITASATKVLSGGSVNLTVTERNTGSDNLTNPYVEVWKDGTLLATLKAPPDSGDTAGLGVLNVGETWSWNISSGPITATTTFVALGFGTDSLGNEVSYEEGYLRERDEVTVETEEPVCPLSPGYWKTHSRYGPAPYDDTWALIKPDGEDTIFFLSGKTYYRVMWTPASAGNAYYILAFQYIAAELNFLNGAFIPAEVQVAFDEATALFEKYTPYQVGSWRRSNQKEIKEFLRLAEILDDYNNGRLFECHE